MYIPSRDGDLILWADNFDTLVDADPPRYGLTPGDATTIDTYVDDFRTKLTTATNPATRTQTSVADKDGAKAAMLAIIRPYAQQIRHNMGVSNADKLSLGLTVPDTNPTPIPAPSTNPLVSIIGALPLQQTIRYADSATPDKRGKPKGCLGLQLFVYIGTVPPTGIHDYDFKAFVTKQPFAADFLSADVGKQAYYLARWQTATGKVGPFSSPVNMTVAG